MYIRQWYLDVSSDDDDAAAAVKGLFWHALGTDCTDPCSQRRCLEIQAGLLEVPMAHEGLLHSQYLCLSDPIHRASDQLP